MGVNYDKQINQYVQLNLKWNIKRMLLINKINVSISDLLMSDAIDNLLVFILFGLDKHELKRAVDILEGWFELFGEYKTLKSMIVIDLKDRFGFIREKKDDDIVDVFEQTETDNKIPTHDEIIKIEKDNLEYAIKVYMKSGYSYEQAIEMDMSNFEFFNNYILEQREQILNDNLSLLHRLSAWITIGVNNPKEFPQTIDKIRLRPLSKEEKIKEIRDNTIEFYKSMSEEV